MILLHWAALLLAVGLTPWSVSRLLSRGSGVTSTLALWGPAMVALNIMVPIALHLASVPITAHSLAAVHATLGLVMLGSLLLAGRHRHPASIDTCPPLLTGALVLFAILVIPVTHIAGIDTYKWQDLAGAMAVEQRISWLIHPLSLLGFTPRSYPSAQPLVLGSLEILGHTGVDWGFYVLSLAMGVTGLFGAWRLGLFLLTSRRQAAWFACLYLLAPVFMRYNYWATGRGFLLALLPAYLLTLFRTGFYRQASTPLAIPFRSRLPALLVMTGLLALSHKAGFVGVVIIPLLFMASPLLAAVRGRLALVPLLLLAMGGGFALASFAPGLLIWRWVTRFGVLVPLAVAGLVAGPRCFATPPARAMMSAFLALLALSSTPDMYGALLALPFITFVAVAGAGEMMEPRPWLVKGVAVASVVGAIAIVVNQATDSPPGTVYRTAQFLEQHDPTGPYRIEAPGRIRTQVQAYVAGCPRFTVEAGERASIRLHRPPALTGTLPRDARHWIDYLRDLLDVKDASTDWYGSAGKLYTITTSTNDPVPSGSRLIHSEGQVNLYESGK